MIISKTPLRISFVGGGTDFPDFYKENIGRAISTGIDKYFYVIVNKRFDDLIECRYSKIETVDKLEHIEHPLIREALLKTGVKKGVDIVSISDISARKTGLGLGASSAFTVGLLKVLTDYSPTKLAETAYQIETKYSSLGKQDHYACAFGGLNMITFGKEVKVEPIKISPEYKHLFHNHLMLFFTGKERSAQTILKKQKQNIPDKTEILKEMSKYVLSFKQSLEEGDFRTLGYLLDYNWELKKQLAEGISNPEIDEAYNTAKKAGAWGGKILGAGGGGFMLIMAPPDKQDKIKKALKYKLVPFNFSENGSEIWKIT